jgi:putative transposase
MTQHKHLKRLERIWIQEPIFFITTCTYQRRSILTNPQIAQILVEEWQEANARHGWMVGRYVIMLDHVHFFCTPVAGIVDPGNKTLSRFMQQW